MVAPSLLRSEPQGWRGRPIKVGTELSEGDDCIWTKLDSSPQISALFRTTHLDKLSDEVAAETSKPYRVYHVILWVEVEDFISELLTYNVEDKVTSLHN